MMDGMTYPSIGIMRHRIVTDGDGVTTLIASHGCPLRCKYCLNSQCLRSDTKITTYTMDTLLKKVAIDDLYFQATGGGLTFGGGEPLLQSEFIHEFLKRCPAEWKINLETSLSVPLEKLLPVIPDVDFYLIDIKDMNPVIYEHYTGRTNENVIQNLKYLAEHVPAEKIKIRLPLIPEYNTPEDVDTSERMLREMGFHQFDRFTYKIK